MIKISIKYWVLLTSLVLLTSSVIAKPLLNIQHWQTQTGVPVYFVQTNQLPMLDVSVVFNAGSARDGSQYGLANFTNAMLNEGAGKLSATDIAEQFENVGAQYSNSVDKDSSAFNLRTLTDAKTLKQSLTTFNLVLTQPTFNAQSVRRIKQQILVALQSQQQDPNAIAAKTFMSLLYGSQPYGHLALGEVDTINPIKSADMQKFYQQYYTQNNALIVMVGDLSLDQAKQISNQLLQGMKVGQAASALPASQALNPHGITKNINLPIPQTVVMMGNLGVARNSPDYFPLLLSNYIMGGSSDSLLFNTVREQQGLSYFINSQFVQLAQPGPFIIMLQTANANTAKASSYTKQTVETYLASGPTNQQLNRAKQDLENRLPSMLDDNSKVLSAVSTIAFYHLPLNFWDTFVSNINAVTSAQAKTAMQRYVLPKQFVVVTVGG